MIERLIELQECGSTGVQSIDGLQGLADQTVTEHLRLRGGASGQQVYLCTSQAAPH